MFVAASVALLAAAPTTDVQLLVVPPGCAGSGNTSINLITALFEHFEHADGSAIVSSSGTATLRREGSYLLPEANLADGLVVRRLFSEPDAFSRELLDAELPVLVSPYEIDFQYPYRGHFDWLGVIERQTGRLSEYPDTTRVHGRLWRYRAADGASILALDLGEGDAAVGELLTWRPGFGGRAEIVAPDDSTRLYIVGKALAHGPRLLAELAALKSALPAESSLVLHGGNVVETEERAERRGYCAEAAAATGPFGIVPAEGELNLGPAELRALAERHGLPYVAANLSVANGAAPFPRFRLRQVGGLTVAVIGIVGRDQLERLPASVRSEWQLEDVHVALRRATEQLEEQLGRRPELTIALVAARGDDYASVVEAEELDLVVGDFSRGDLMHVEESVRPGAGGREEVRSGTPLAALRMADTSLGRIDVRYEREPALRLAEIRMQSRPVLEEGPVDALFDRRLREHQEAAAIEGFRLALPDAAPLVTNNPELDSLIWGEHILHRRGFRRYDRKYPARYSDPLWMRLVTNSMREALGADVGLSRNLPRTSDMVGPIFGALLRNWLAANDSVRLVRVSGAVLERLRERLRRQEIAGAVRPEAFLFASALDAASGRVGGRPIDPRAVYTVATTDTVLDMPELRPVFADAPVSEAFVAGEPFEAASEGAPLLLRDLLQQQIDSWRGADGSFDGRHTADVERLLADQSQVVLGRWLLDVAELSVRGSGYDNRADNSRYAETRETRVVTPDNYSLGGRGNIALTYDGPSLAWESRLRLGYDRVLLDVAGQEVPPQEPSDDVVASTELRFHAVSLEAGGEGIRLLPFAQLAYDTELTPTLDAEGKEQPHQRLARGSAGLVLYPGNVLKELRLGGVYQHDFGEPEWRREYGALAGYKLGLPLIGPLSLTSELDLRWFVDDPDDRAADLGLVAAWVNKLVVPLAEEVSLFLFSDSYFVRGKLPGYRKIGGSTIFGGGIEISQLLRLN